MERVRIRVEFENRQILSKPQRSEGLKRSWILLKPQQHKSISDVTSYILRIFDLHHSCPNGILLSMEGFVLPPFESTCILKDKDIICVKKKGSTLSDIIEVGDGANSVEEIDIDENQPIHTGLPLIANEEFEKETGGCQSEAEEDEEEHPEEILPVENSSDAKAASKKRKASKKLKSSKKKKCRSVVSDAVENDVKSKIEVESTPEIAERNKNNVEPTSSGKRKKKRRSVVSDAVENDVKSKTDVESTPEIAERSNNIVEPTISGKRSDQLKQTGEGMKDVAHLREGTTKVPSRSARRKKAKRQWLREITKAEKEGVVCHPKELDKSESEKKELVSHAKGLLHWRQLPEQNVNKDIMEHAQPNQNNDVEDDLVPVVIRPGHIRFEPLGEDQAVQQSQVSVETYGWNGITSKKKGQKWGQQNFSSLRMNGTKSLSKEYSETLTVEEETTVKGPIDFDKLPPLPSLPKEGDMIAYRLLELSSSWTPELSSFRVGRVSSFDPQSTRVLLTPVSEYPIISEKLDEDSSEMQPENSLYREDGSLEIEFSSLDDVRIVKHSDSHGAEAAVNGSVNEGPQGNTDALLNSVTSKNDKETQAPMPQENGEVKNAWDEISEALNAKKAQLSEENDDSSKKGRSPWSYRALRGSALGPTMAILRSKNGILE
ncbi:hypothetical protein LguiB_031414 [Lonicera macranthoides]